MNSNLCHYTEDLTCFRPLLTALGVRDAFGARDYVGLLHRLSADVGAAPLDAPRLELALWVLGTLAVRQCRLTSG